MHERRLRSNAVFDRDRAMHHDANWFLTQPYLEVGHGALGAPEQRRREDPADAVRVHLAHRVLRKDESTRSQHRVNTESTMSQWRVNEGSRPNYW